MKHDEPDRDGDAVGGFMFALKIEGIVALAVFVAIAFNAHAIVPRVEAAIASLF